jgi:hypothetical protein
MQICAAVYPYPKTFPFQERLLCGSAVSNTPTPRFMNTRFTRSLSYFCLLTILFVSTGWQLTAQTETEPNNTLATANPATFSAPVGGGLCAPDNDDYFRVIQPAGGNSIRLITTASMNTTGQTGGIYTYLYNKYGTPLTGKFMGLTSNGFTDTLDYTCFEGDTFFVRVYDWSGSCKSYSLRCENTGYFTLRNDTEMNDALTSATGLLFQKDTTGHLGAQRYGVAAYTDNDDYYRCVLPAGGMKSLRLTMATRMVAPGSTGGLYYYLYDKYGTPLSSKFVSATTTTRLDTLDHTCFEADTFFVRVHDWSGECKEYRIKMDYTGNYTMQNDPEMNDALATATPLTYQKDTTGHLGSYRYGTAAYTDNDDYYRCALPAGSKSLRLICTSRMVEPGTTGSMYYYLYNKYGTPLVSKFVGASTTPRQDTLDYTCFEGDSFFVRVYNWSGSCKEYRIRVGNTGNFTLKNDTEPNDAITSALPVTMGRDTTGHLASMIYTPTSTRTDNDDYFRCIMPPDGLGVRIILNARQVEPGETGSVFYYLYNKSGAALGNKFVSLTSAVKPDTLQLSCAMGDTFFVRLYSWSGSCKEYTLRVDQIGSKPIAKIRSARTGNDFGFTAQTQHADWIEWDFANGKKSGFVYPAQSFAIGTYNVKLRAQNTACNIIYTDSMLVRVAGIESYTPNKAGAGGDLLMTVYGGGLIPTTAVKLIRGSTTLIPFETQSNAKQNTLSANFDLHFAKPGTYDVEITIPGEAPVLYRNGMKIDSFRYPFSKAEIIGPTRWRINSDTRFELKVSNSGNVFSNGAIVGFAYPKSVAVTFTPKQIKLNRNVSTSVMVDGETFTLSNASTAKYADSASQPMPISSLRGKPYDGYLILLKIPKVPSDGSVSIPFTARTAGAGSPSFYAFTHHPNQFGSCETPHWSNVTNMWAAEAIDAVDMAADKANAPGLFKGLIKATKIAQKHLAYDAAYAGAQFDAWWNGYDVTAEMYGNLNAELDEANAFALQTATDELGNALFDKALGKLVANNKVKNEWWNKTLADNMDASPEEFNTMIDKMNALSKGTARLEKLNTMLKTVKDLKTLNDKIATLMKLVEDCPELEPQLADLLKLLDEELEHKDPNDKPTQSVTSMDPNAIYGPEGVLAARYRKDGERMHYMITCENMDTASAPAQVVRIIDTLDKTKFDLSTFEFGNVYIGRKATRLLNGRGEFFGEVSLAPDVPLAARIMAKLDTATGIITWTMIGIDAATGTLPTDPDLGLLPPNVLKPVGEAAVNYSVKLKPGLPGGTMIRNMGLIYFDGNDPIATNVWSNTLDITKPVSRVSDAAVVNDTLVRLRFSGTDAESGIAGYRLFVHADTGTWQHLAITAADSMLVAVEPRKPYRFYVTSIDYVGNVEDKIPISEASVGIPQIGKPTAGNVYAIYPNPTTGELSIHTSSKPQVADLTITDVTGRQVSNSAIRFDGARPARLMLSNLSPGVYLITIGSGDGATETHRLVLTQRD